MKVGLVIIIIIIIIIRHAPCQCVAPLATNSLHSDLSKASSIASWKVRLCRDRSLFRVAIQEVGAPNWPTPITLMDTRQNPPGVSCLVHSGQVAKQHESSLVFEIDGWKLLSKSFGTELLDMHDLARWWQRVRYLHGKAQYTNSLTVHLVLAGLNEHSVQLST